MRLSVPSFLASFAAVMVLAGAPASSENEGRPDLKRFRSRWVEFTNQYLATSTNILPAPAERVASDVLPRVGIVLTSKTNRPLWVLVRFMRPSGDPACDWAGPLDPKEATKFACTLDTVIAEVDYPVDIVVFSDEANADTVEKLQTRLVFPKGDVKIIQGRLEHRRHQLEYAKVPRTLENVIVREKLGFGANLKPFARNEDASHLGTLVVKADGLEHRTNDRTITIAAGQLRGWSLQMISFHWVFVVNYDDGGTQKKIGFQAGHGADDGFLDNLQGAIETLMEQTAEAKQHGGPAH